MIILTRSRYELLLEQISGISLPLSRVVVKYFRLLGMSFPTDV